MIKWKLLIGTLPYILVVTAIKLGLDLGLGVHGFLDFSDVGLVLTGGVFLIGFMLAGTMADYKESEKLPGELACTLETIEETFKLAAGSKSALDAVALQRLVLEATKGIHDWLYKKISQEKMYETIEGLEKGAKLLEKAGATPYSVRALNEINVLRKTVTRIAVISRTGFLASGYALLETLTVLIIGLLMISKFKSAVAEVILVVFVTLIYVYMLRLIRDIDDPFEYSSDGAQEGAAEVELFPLAEYQQRLEARMPGNGAHAGEILGERVSSVAGVS